MMMPTEVVQHVARGTLLTATALSSLLENQCEPLSLEVLSAYDWSEVRYYAQCCWLFQLTSRFE